MERSNAVFLNAVVMWLERERQVGRQLSQMKLHISEIK